MPSPLMSPPRKQTPRRSDPATGSVRLQKILAAAGIASRRAAEEMIRAGRVAVNGTVVVELGTRAHPAGDRIEVDGHRIGRPRRPVYHLLHKPRGVVTTTRDPHAKRTVLDLVPKGERLFPVGRLDAASEGLLLVTNDGELAQVLMHPSFEVPRNYRVSVDGFVPDDALRTLEQGIVLDGRRTAPCTARLRERTRERSVIDIELIEGRRRQIRRALKELGYPVRRLVRTRFGPLTLAGLAPGASRRLHKREVEALRELVARASRAGRQSAKRSKPKG